MSCGNHDWRQFRCPNCSDGVPANLNSDSLIRDGEVYRHDWEGSPRFYHVRIYPIDPHPVFFTPWVKLHVTLEGDPTAWADARCDSDSEYINAALFACIFQIECMRANQWDSEQDNERQQMNADYWRSRI